MMWDGMNSEGLGLGLLWQVGWASGARSLPGLQNGCAVLSLAAPPRRTQLARHASGCRICLPPLQSNVTFHKAWDPQGPATAMTLADLPHYALANFATVAEAREQRGCGAGVRPAAASCGAPRTGPVPLPLSA